MDDWLDSSDAVAIAGAIRAKEVSAREVVQHALDRLERRNPSINAVVETRAEAALDEADRASGPLAGVPFVVKDLGADVRGMRSTSGSRLRADRIATADATIVARYRQAGFVIIATTTSAEFGRSPSTETVMYGPTRNPHDPGRSAGGSSGGTAAAVAAGIVPPGHGNDGGGSIRIPASMCGLVGLKPSRGRTPAYPRRTAFAYPVGINHVLTRSVRDSAVLLDIGRGAVPGDSTFALGPDRPYEHEAGRASGRVRVALSTTLPDGSGCDPAAAGAARAAGRLVEQLGHVVVEATPPYPHDLMRDTVRVIMSVSLAADVDATLAELGRPLGDDDLEPFTRTLYEVGRHLSGTDVFTGLQNLERVGHELAPFFAAHDVLLTPTVPVPTPPIGLLDPTDVDAMRRHAAPIAALTSFCNVTGQPAISLPLARWPDGLPLGIQLVAAVGREDLLLRLAAQIEAAAPWDALPSE